MLNLAMQLLEQGKSLQALPIIKEHCANNPQDASGWFFLGACYHHLTQLVPALEAFESALLIEPAHLQAISAKGTVLSELGRPQEAIIVFNNALFLAPTDPQLRLNLGVLLEQSGNLVDALEHYNLALSQHPNFAAALLNRGALLLRMHRLQEALANNRTLVESYPKWAHAHYNLGETLLALADWQGALSSYEQTLKINPNASKAIFGCGLALSMLKRFSDARQAFERAQQLDLTVYNLCLQQASALIEGELREITPCNLYLLREVARLEICDWHHWGHLADEFVALIANPHHSAGDMAEPALLFRTFSLPLPAEAGLNLATRIAKRLAEKVAHYQPYTHVLKHPGRIRIAYISPDFRTHPTAFLSRRLYALHNRKYFEVYVYSLHPGDGSSLRIDIEQGCDIFRELSGMADHTVSDIIFRDGIDILVDLAGYTMHARPEILAMRPAPLQLCYLGFPHSTGAEFIDYFVADPIVISPATEKYFSEKIAYLPDSYFLFDNLKYIPQLNFTRKKHGLPEGVMIFCCHNSIYKITPDVFDSWMRILQGAPGSVLWLFSNNIEARNNLHSEAKIRGISTDRLIFADFVPSDIHLARYRLADLFLDTYHCNAHTTAAEALWTGLPVLTCMGKKMASRVASSLLTAIGLHEMITNTPEQYEEKAIYLATHPEELARIRTLLEHNRLTTPLFNTEQQVKNIEAVYEHIWERHKAGLPPETLHANSPGSLSRPV